ncbi:ribonuclease E inhibitor RraB [Serratia microhaemolytica]|uniref:ribonuclease E inhibitor RraB n=1 Tax=Serratia microhaemolytica TaxID=2675110 RepID=UPI000FDDA462|nr:ribonuclease E inhibitor RraB [Serratia microhaemolytica]
MASRELLEEQREETRRIIEELLEDGSDPDALYTIEHHLSAKEFDVLEQLAVEAFKLGYEVSDAEELEVDDDTGEHSLLTCCDVIGQVALDAELIDQQVEQIMALADKYQVNYDGWGTYYQDPDGDDEYDDDEDEPGFIDHDDDGKRH